jgi:DNA-binding SARP family transcriptional activator
VEFRLLGPLEVVDDGRSIYVGRRRERSLLGVLLLQGNVAVPVERLLELLWEQDPPATARASLHTHIARLRACLNRGGGPSEVRLVGGDAGYRIEVDRRLVDAHRFRALVDQARTQADPAVRAVLLREALALWRGPILADDASDRLRDRVGAPLTELRLTATELLVDSELARGRHRELIGELTAMTAEHPHSERLIGQLMLALYRSGRQADALDAYQRFCCRLARDLGVDPGLDLRQLHTAVLRHAPELSARGHDRGWPVAGDANRVRPAMLPPDVADFTGRAADVAHLTSALRPDQGHAMAGAVITGPGGVGKTTLAVHVAHQLAHEFADGQLYANLHGMHTAPADPFHVLGRFLRMLGVNGTALPGSLDERVETYRDLLAGRRVLVVLDDAKGQVQLRPLLPGSPTCAVIVTSRARLSGFEGGHRLTLDVFTPPEAVALLARVCGDERVPPRPTSRSRSLSCADTCRWRSGSPGPAWRCDHIGRWIGSRPGWRRHTAGSTSSPPTIWRSERASPRAIEA